LVLEFVKAFLIFLAFIVFVGIVLSVVCYVLYCIYISIQALIRKFKNITPRYKYSFKPNKKIVKIGLVIFISSSILFYISKFNDYILSDRPYKEAKAYAIAGEYMMILQMAFGNYRTADTLFYQTLQNIQQKLVLDNIYRLIPENDAERDIWRYKFYQYIYARSFWAPVNEKTKKRGLDFTAPNASFEPELITILLDIYDSTIRLDTLPIQDKEFDRIYRYITMANMLQYYSLYYRYQIRLDFDNYLPYEDENNRNRIFNTTPYYIDQYQKYIHAIDHIKEAMEKDSELAQKFESMPHAKAALYWAGVRTYAIKMNALTIIYKIYPCDTKEIKQFVKYLDEYLVWSRDRFSSFSRKFDRNRKNQYDFMIQTAVNEEHYIAKYICGEKFQGLTYREEWAIKDGATLDELPKQMKYHENYKPVTDVLKLREELNITNQGEDNGR
jgi:hypothetical protein